MKDMQVVFKTLPEFVRRAKLLAKRYKSFKDMTTRSCLTLWKRTPFKVFLWAVESTRSEWPSPRKARERVVEHVS